MTYKFEYSDYRKGINGKVSLTMKLKKINIETEIPKTNYIKDPTIGMTKEEARKSTWGEPQKINTTTTRYGVHEQWVYSGNRYLYFDNGILTSIQN